jgi:2C-methyl-D-erythritol 2,4-cyclodiphosphate synthase
MNLELYVSKVYNAIKAKVSDNQAKISSYTDIILIGMQEVEKFKQLSGADKSKVLLIVLQLIINNNLLPLNILVTLNIVVKAQICQPIIDTIVSACNGDISLKDEVKAKAQEKFGCFGLN